MKGVLALVALVGCKAAPPPTVSNHASTESGFVAGPNCIVQGRVTDAATRESLAGATLVAEGGPGKEDIAISDENGAFSIKLTGAHEKLTIYYNDGQGSRPLHGCGERIEVKVRQQSSGPVIVW